MYFIEILCGATHLISTLSVGLFGCFSGCLWPLTMCTKAKLSLERKSSNPIDFKTER